MRDYYRNIYSVGPAHNLTINDESFDKYGHRDKVFPFRLRYIEKYFEKLLGWSGNTMAYISKGASGSSVFCVLVLAVEQFAMSAIHITANRLDWWMGYNRSLCAVLLLLMLWIRIDMSLFGGKI